MGNFNEHVLFGFMLALFTLLILDGKINFDTSVMLASVLTVFIGSVIPDVDHKKAYVHRSVKAFTSIVSALLVFAFTPLAMHYSFILASATFLTIFIFISKKKMQHRGFTHSISFLLIVSSLTLIPGKFLTGSSIPGVAMSLGIFSHLLLDGEFKLS